MTLHCKVSIYFTNLVYLFNNSIRVRTVSTTITKNMIKSKRTCLSWTNFFSESRLYFLSVTKIQTFWTRSGAVEAVILFITIIGIVLSRCKVLQQFLLAPQEFLIVVHCEWLAEQFAFDAVHESFLIQIQVRPINLEHFVFEVIRARPSKQHFEIFSVRIFERFKACDKNCEELTQEFLPIYMSFSSAAWNTRAVDRYGN